MIKVLIVEDNVEEAEQLRGVLIELQPQAEIFLCESGEDAYEIIKDEKKKIDIFFLNRELPGMDGFALTERIRAYERYKFTPIVFVTGHDMNQLHAFQEYHCYHYILKPFSKELLGEKVGGLLEHIKNEKPKPLNKLVSFKNAKGEGYVLANDIFFIEKLGKNCLLYTADKEYEIPRISLEKMVAEINESYLVRCHKSFAVNLKNILEINKIGNELWTVVFINDNKYNCYIGDVFHKTVKEKYKEFMGMAKKER